MQKAFDAIESTVGLKVVCHVEWELIFAELDADFSDKSTLVPTICGLVVTWCDSLSTRLEDDNCSAWTDQVVEKLEAAGSLKLQIQVCIPSSYDSVVACSR